MAAKDEKIKIRRVSGDETFSGADETTLVDADGNEITEDTVNAEEEESLVGQMLGGRYLIKSLIGKGGMGAVYRAQNTLLDSQVAIKVLLPGQTVNAKVVLRLQKEARALVRLEHSSLVRVFEFDIDEERQQPYLVMKLEEGESLASIIKRGPMAAPEAVKLIIQAADALQHAHSHGIIHRDLKPSNMLVSKGENGEEQIKILDFGIAKINDPKTGTMGLTQTGELFGSPQYMSPEQCKGQPIDVRTDIYSLACVLHEMLTGKPAADAENTLEILMQHANGLNLDYSQSKVPGWLQGCLRHALAKEKESRYASMSEFSESLKSGADKKDWSAVPPFVFYPKDQAGAGFVHDPVVQVGVPPSPPGEKELEAEERSRGIGLGVCFVLLIMYVVYGVCVGH